MKIIAKIKNGYKTKFGIPRQSGLVNSVVSVIEFEKEYRVREAFLGLEEYTHLWIIWDFSMCENKEFSPTVRPPMLGGNKRVGVFATRSPNRPNNIGLSVVKIERISYDETNSPLIYVSGADLMNGTPIYDIKPYIPYADSISDAKGGFTDNTDKSRLSVECASDIREKVRKEDFERICDILSLDPKPRYIREQERIYGMEFSDYEIKFRRLYDKIEILSIEEKGI